MKQIMLKSVTASAVRRGVKIVNSEIKNKKTVINLKQPQGTSSVFKTDIQFIRVPRKAEERQRGILHKAVGLRDRVQGDVPSISKKLNFTRQASDEKKTGTTSSDKPKVTAGIVGTTVLKGSYKTLKAASRAVTGAALEAENIVLLTSDVLNPRKRIQFTITNPPPDSEKRLPHIEVTHVKRNERHERGLVHRAVAFRRSFDDHFKGDVPTVRVLGKSVPLFVTEKSINRMLDSMQPKTIAGITAVSAAKGTHNFVRYSVRTAENAVKGAENVALYAGDRAVQTAKQKANAEIDNSGDTGKAAVKTASIVASGASGLRRHIVQKRNFKYEKSQLKKFKGEQQQVFKKIYDTPTFKKKHLPWVEVRDRSDKVKLKDLKTKNKALKKRISESGGGTSIQRGVLIARKQKIKAQKKEIHQNNLMLKMQKDRVNIQKRIVRREKPVPLALKPGVHAVKSAAASGWRKAASADQSNDVMKVVDKSASLLKKGGMIAGQARHFSNRMQVKLYDHSVMSAKKNAFKKSNPAFKKRQSPQASWKSVFRKKWKQWHDPNAKSAYSGVSSFVKDTVKSLRKAARSSLKSSAAGFLTAILPIAFSVLCLIVVGSLVVGIISKSGFIAGTYYATDIDLTEAIYYYTNLANSKNNGVLKLGSSGTWRSGLNSAGGGSGFNLLAYPDLPTEIVYGKNSVYLNYDEAEYDFDPYVLWSFLCAYYYDFEASDEAAEKGESYEPDYWKYNRETQHLIKQLFDNEYGFEFYYDNTSRWEEKDPYEIYGGGSGSSGGGSFYYFADPGAYVYDSEPYKFRFKPKPCPAELTGFKDSEGFICIDSDLRVLNAKKSYALTGYMIMDHRYGAGEKAGFYYWDDSLNDYWFRRGSTEYGRSSWGWDRTDSSGNPYREEAWFLISPTDTNLWKNSLTDTCLYGFYEKYEWKTDCRFYYVVTQNGSMIDNAKKLLRSTTSDNKIKKERIDYFEGLLGQKDNMYYGNHQLCSNPIDSKKDIHQLIEDDKVYHTYGLDMRKWNEKHCALCDGNGEHEGIDIICNANTKVTAMITGTITDIDTTKHTVQISTDNQFNFWYDDKKNCVRITLQNVQIKSGLTVGSKVNSDDVVGTVTNDRKCLSTFTNSSKPYVHILIESGKNQKNFEEIDPLLLIY